MPTAAQLGLDITQKRAALAAIFSGSKNDAGEYDLSVDQLAEVEKRNDELTTLTSEYEKAARLELIAEKALAGARAVPAASPTDAPEAKARVRSVRELLADAKTSNHGAFMAGQAEKFKLSIPEAEWKTIVSLSGIAPNADRQPQITGYPLAVTTIDDLLLPGETESNTVTYYEETAETDNTAFRTEGSAVTDNAMTFTLRTDTLRSNTSWQPFTREAFGDVPQLESFIRERLPMLLAAKRTASLIDGTGVAPIILGLMRRTNVQTQAKGADPVFDAILKGMTLGSVTGDASPTALIFHPNDWQDLCLTRTADGLYILGNPGAPMASGLWGLQVRVTPQAVENTAVVLSRPFVQLFRRAGQGVTIETSTEHSTYFTERSIAVLAEERLTLACYRGQSIVKVTGI